MDLKGLEVLVVGLAKSGLAAIEFLVEKGAHPHGTDSRALMDVPGAGPILEKLRVPYVQQTAKAFAGYDLIVLSPGVPNDLPELEAARARGQKIIGEVELAGYYLRGPKIGITGSNGKTTTTALIGHILKESGVACQVGGNLGWPLTAMVASSRDDQFNVLELSSFQLETISHFRVDTAVVVNITPDHLDRHHTLEAYIAAKRRIVETQDKGSRWVLNADDQAVAAFAGHTPAAAMWFSLDRRVANGFWFNGRDIVHESDGRIDILMPASEIPLRGLHNVQNAMAAAGAAITAGVSIESIRAAVRSFPGVEHRLEFVRELNGVKYYNDSKATNVDATLKAIDAFEGGLWVILGGKDKGSDYAPLVEPLQAKARAALLIGKDDGAKIRTVLEGKVDLVSCGTLEAAVHYAANHAQSGDTVLLAPACASFDQFKNYEERGKMFKTFVSQIVVK